MSDIFICYSSKNRDVADRLLTCLRAEGWSVWMDTHTLTGTKWRNEIKKQLAQARSVVALWSAAAEESDYVMDEAEDAKKRGILVPALIESMQLPYGFRQIQTASLIGGWNGEADHPGVQQLLAALLVHLKKAEEEQPAPIRWPSPGQTFRDKLKIGGEGPLMVVIPAGRFLMGSPPEEPERSDSEGPQHEVRIAKPFAMAVYAVAFDNYDRFCESRKREKPEDQGWGRANRPVIDVSWEDAQAYCSWLSEQTGCTYRLPSRVSDTSSSAIPRLLSSWITQVENRMSLTSAAFPHPRPFSRREKGEKPLALTQLAGGRPVAPPDSASRSASGKRRRRRTTTR